jgi:SMI1/KNR4 family protein SUKH-1
MKNQQVPPEKRRIPGTPLRIGAEGWEKRMRELVAPLGPDFWKGFTPVSASEIKNMERQIGRKLPEEFVEFYRTVGHGSGPQRWGGFFAPEYIIENLAAPIWYITGSMAPTEEWCSREAQNRLWKTRGAYNPVPTKFTEEVLTLDGVPLYDLLMFGGDGGGGEYTVYVGPPPNPLGFAILNDCQEMESRAATFSEGIETILRWYLDLYEDGYLES